MDKNAVALQNGFNVKSQMKMCGDWETYLIPKTCRKFYKANNAEVKTGMLIHGRMYWLNKYGQ